MTMQPLTCPKCGSPDLEELTWNRRRCRHCGTESVLSSDRTCLQLVEWVCPSCGFNNESGTAFCGQCGARLTKKCPECSHQIRIDLQFCNFCGANYETVLAERLRQRREQGIAALEKARKAQQNRLSTRAIWLGMGIWCLFYCLLAYPGMLVGLAFWRLLTWAQGIPHGLAAQEEPFEHPFAILGGLLALAGAILLAIWFTRRKRSQWLEGIDQEFASKRQTLEEALAKEYKD